MYTTTCMCYTVGTPIPMEINTLKVTEHRGCNVYVRNFKTTFEYLVIIKGKLYTSHIVINPSFLRMFARDRYTPEQITAVTKQLLVMAEATIDTVLDSK